MNGKLFKLSMLALASMALFAAGCDKKEEAPQIKVSGFKARAVPAGAPTSAIYMSIENQGQAADALLSAKAEGVPATELHETVIDDQGVMNMNKLERIEIPAQSTVSFEPGGLHVMLIGLKEGLADGDSVNLDLSFEKAGKISLSVPVKSLAMHKMPMDHNHMKGMGGEKMPMDHKMGDMPNDEAHQGMMKNMPNDATHQGVMKNMPKDEAHQGMMKQEN